MLRSRLLRAPSQQVLLDSWVQNGFAFRAFHVRRGSSDMLKVTRENLGGAGGVEQWLFHVEDDEVRYDPASYRTDGPDE